MKLPPKTLHRPSQFDEDNVSELTMRDYYYTDHPPPHNATSSDTESTHSGGAKGAEGGSVGSSFRGDGVNNGGSRGEGGVGSGGSLNGRGNTNSTKLTIGGSGGSSKPSQKTKKQQVKNRLSKYLTRKVVGSSTTKGGGGEGVSREGPHLSSSGRLLVNDTTTTTTGGRLVNNNNTTNGNNNSRSFSNGNTVKNGPHNSSFNSSSSKNHHQSFTSTPNNSSSNNNTNSQSFTSSSNSNNNLRGSNLKSTLADQMVANMFSNNNNNNNSVSSNSGGVVVNTSRGVERAQSWKNEVCNSVASKGSSSSVAGSAVGSIVSKGSAAGSILSRGGASETGGAHKSMEYSSMNVTKERALGYQLEAVGAAAVAVEFGGGGLLQHHDDDDGGGNGGQSKGRDGQQQQQQQQRSTIHQQGPTTTGGGSGSGNNSVVGVGRKLKGKDNLFNGEGGEVVSNFRAGVRMKKKLSSSLTSTPTTAANAVKENEVLPPRRSSEEQLRKRREMEEEHRRRRRTVGSVEDVPPSKTTKKNLTDLELLGQTVQCVNAALQSSTTSSSSSTMNQEQGVVNNYHISSFKFNPRGCVWYAALTITKADRKLQVPLKVTCHAKDNKKSSSSSSSTTTTTAAVQQRSTIYTIKISYYEPPPSTSNTTTTNWTTTFHENFATTLKHISNHNDLVLLWVHYQLEITESMEWLRRKLRRWINRSMSGMIMEQQQQLLPDVIVVVPEGKQQQYSGDGGVDNDDDSNNPMPSMDLHRQDGKRRNNVAEDNDDRSRSPLLKSSSPLKRSLKSVDPSTTKTATTCSLSSHSPSRDPNGDGSSSRSHQSEEEEARIRARILEARRELVGSRGSDSGNGHGTTTTTTTTTTVVKEKKKKNETLDRFKGGLVSQHTMRNLLANVSSDEEDSEEEEEEEEEQEESEEEQEMCNAYQQPNSDERSNLVNPVERGSRGEMSDEKSLRTGEVSSGGAACRVDRFRSGLWSRNTMKDILQEDMKRILQEAEEEAQSNDDASDNVVNLAEDEARGDTSGEEILRTGSSGDAACRVDQFRSGLVSQHTMKRILQDDTEDDMAQVVEAMCLEQRAEGEIDSNMKGEMKRVPSQIHVSFQDDSHSDIAETEELKIQQTAENNNKTIVAATKKVVVSEDDDDEQDAGMLLFSNNDLQQSKKLDVLTEGQYFLGISMLVYMYSHLRETCRMGHTRTTMHDVDTNSVQSQYKKGGVTKYLSATKTAGSIIRLVIDELEDADEDDAEHEIVGGESKEYERQQTAQFRKWIDDSRISQMDEETEKMLINMKKKVARHRWRRAISAVRLSIRISGGKPPKWENPVVAPGCENCNRFVDMNAMMSETMRKQPKYFKEGSVMNNLIESGIEVVWFSDLSQNDVVYGICVNREEKKIIIAFRGTVNAHNWSMNFKFDTNEYRNPVKHNYPGREDELSLHSGFALYLLRKRKDTGLSKMDEIFEKVEQIGKELAPDGDYKLCITGHSLGGALATLCGFYFGAKPRFAHLSTIYIWTFAAPRVGTQAFIHAYQYLERTGRIRHARFSCTNDIVPLIPFCNFEYDDLQFYKHVGIRVQLHNTGRIGKWRLRNNLDVTYPLKHDWPSEIQRMLTNNFFANLNTPKGFKDFHGLTEHQRRLHFAMTYRKALGSSTLNSDQKRKRIKTLDEYYLIRGNITTEGIAEEIVDIRKVDKVKKKGGSSSKWLVRFLVILLLFTWILLILSITTDVPLECVLVPFTMVLRGIEHLVHLPVTLPSVVYQSMMFRAQHMIHSILVGTRHVGKSSFVARTAPPNIAVMKKIAKERVKNNSSRHAKEIIDAKAALMQEDSSKFQVFERTSLRLYNLASIVDDVDSPELTIGTRAEGKIPYEFQYEGGMNDLSGDVDGRAELEALESRLSPIQEYATSVSFAPKLDNGLYLVGAGVRKKSVVKVYAVAMYSTPKVLVNAVSSTTLHEAAKTFDSSSAMTSFVLEMVYSAGAEKIAGAIGESVKPRHSGDPSDIGKLESLIVDGVNAIGGQATKGTTFRFDCSEEGVSVSVNGVEQGVAAFKGLGSAFVDVFMDDNSVSPTLIDSCIKTWSSSDYQSLSASLVELASMPNQADSNEGTAEDKADTAVMRRKVESPLKPITEYATSVVFDPKLDEGLYLIGAGVRKKSVVKVYAVALYGSASVLNAVSSPATLRTAARTFDASTPLTSFVLEMTYSASAEKIGGAIADSVKPRYSGPAADISMLESLIVEGVNKKGGQATKGTTFRFDCSEEGVTVNVDGSVQGTAKFAFMGSAFVDVFLDDNAVSPTLVSSCMDSWSNPQAKATAASLLELGEPSDESSSNEQDDEGPSSSLQNAIESNMKAIQEYATSVTFVPKLDDGLYLAGAGVRKKSIVKVYAVAMYTSPVVLQALSIGSRSGMHKAAKSFSPASPSTAFVLEMTYSAGAEKIAGAIAESVKPRYNGNPSDINELEALIIMGVNQKGGQASKGTIFRFDCSEDGVRVSVDGSDQGKAAFEGMGGAFVDVFLDDNAVSPSLIDSCLETWSKVSLL